MSGVFPSSGAGIEADPEVLYALDPNCSGEPDRQTGGAGFGWTPCESAYEVLQQAASRKFELVLLICSAAPEWGLQMCRSLRALEEARNLPIVLWAEQWGADRRISAFEAGADEVLSDLPLAQEVLHRIRARLRRSFIVAEPVSGLHYAGIELDPSRYRVRLAGRAVALSPLQTRLLQALMECPQKVFTRDELASKLWADRKIDAKSINTAVLRLSRLLEVRGHPSPIRTVRGVGYAIDAELTRHCPE